MGALSAIKAKDSYRRNKKCRFGVVIEELGVVFLMPVITHHTLNSSGISITSALTTSEVHPLLWRKQLGVSVGYRLR